MRIGNREFKSQDEALEFTRGIAKRHGNLATIEAGEDFDYLRALFERHPRCKEKIACGLRAFKVITNFGGHLAFSIVRLDGTEADFSFLSCVKGKERSSKAYLSEAMRRAISPQISVFKEYKAKEFKAKVPNADGVNDFQCEECKRRITQKADANVDHIIEFTRLKEDFLSGRTDIPTRFKEHYHQSREFLPSDANFARDWMEFHGQKAILRILCSECNSKRLTKNLILNAVRSFKNASSKD